MDAKALRDLLARFLETVPQVAEVIALGNQVHVITEGREYEIVVKASDPPDRNWDSDRNY